MSEQYDRRWTEHSHAIAELAAGRMSELVPIGGRFVSKDEAEEDLMFDYLTAAGFHICDTGQYEMVATRAVPIDEISIMAAISQMRQLASERGYRLLSVEAGDIEGGTAHVLASEKDYIPWWEVTG